MSVSGFSTPLHKRIAALLRAEPYARPDTRTQLERVVLGVREGRTPSGRPPVRIFVGTEPDQYRAERVFVWSIERVRDPARVYELYLMKDLAGFDRRGWLTGFTNYRFAIPHFAGGRGRAIYNDTDQIYLADPGELFDTAMGNSGFLSIHDHDTSVMLIDCERMASAWTLEAAQRQRRRRLEAEARAIPGLWDQLDSHWNARDDEYDPKRSKLLHYTTIHAQPWQPFPQRFAYQHNPVGQVWLDLEQAANEASYQVFQVHRPSTQYLALCAHIRAASSQSVPPGGSMQAPRNGHKNDFQKHIEKLRVTTQSRTLLDYSFGLSPSLTRSHDPLVSHYNPAFAAPTPSACEVADGVVCTDTLDFLPDEDVPWMLEELFRCAHRFVSVSVNEVPYEHRLPNGTRLQGRVRPLAWWQTHLDATSRRYPKLRWHLRLEAPTDSGRADGDYAGGALGHEPIVWVLTSHKPGHTTQARGLADALGWPYTTKTLHFRGPTSLYKYLLGTDRATRRGLDISQSDVLGPPWPDLVIVAGWRPGRVARWIQHESHGRTHLVLLGRIGSRPVAPTDISIVCEHFRLPPHPRRIETGAPVTQVNPERLETAADTWRDQVEATPRPWIMLLVGGATARHELTSDQADRLGAEVRAFAERLHGTVFATTSRRTGHAAAEALAASLGPRHSVYAWRPDRADNPYLGYLALADLLIVTGESESMLAEAVATEKPVYIYPLAERSAGVLERAKDWVLMRAQSQQRNKRGRPRPQRGLAYVCGRLIERGIVQPRRDLNALHVALIGRGSAAFFPDAGVSNNLLELRPRPALRELDRVTEQVRGLLPFRVQP